MRAEEASLARHRRIIVLFAQADNEAQHSVSDPMRVGVVGGGPAGLYFSYLLKRACPAAEIRIVEQNPANATFGFGVVFSDRALDFLKDDDGETHGLIAPQMETWHDLTIVHRGRKIPIDGVGFAAIGRLPLLQLLQNRLRSVGIEPIFESRLSSLGEFEDYDLIVGADGVNSIVRKGRERAFGTRLEESSNKFAWYGTPKRFDTLTQTFLETDWGGVTAHHYRYAPDMSTFIVEMQADTWERAGFANLTEQESKDRCERIFAEVLEGRPLVANNSIWRRFPRIWNDRWTAENKVLVGDALHTAHFSIGSGTRLAMEDVIALAKAITSHPHDMHDALQSFQTQRKPIVEKLVEAADASLRWYEHMDRHMRLEPYEFAYSYITRSGRVDARRLQQIAPHFMDAYNRYSSAGT